MTNNSQFFFVLLHELENCIRSINIDDEKIDKYYRGNRMCNMLLLE
jgi:hypothetical protein